MGPTPYSDLNAVLRELVEGMQAVLGRTFVAAYLQGSFAEGGFDRHSDVDWLAAVEGELSDGQVAALQVMHERVYGLESAWAQHLEGSYFPKEILRNCAQRGLPLWYLDNGARSLIRSDHCNTAVVRWTVREHGIPLAGPPPPVLVDVVPEEMLLQEIRETIRDWGHQILSNPGHYANHFYQTFIVLSYCRMLHSLHTGRIGSKRAGAEWAKAHLDPSWAGLIDRTWAGRPVPEASVRRPADPADFQSTLDFVRLVIGLSCGDQPPR
ncbi:MAG TPA: DUF4111 domain-containing protein [Anaerolineae bacterium]|nr:DUF4111 domain-containing protein [Anaerolineae bacterium]